MKGKNTKEFCGMPLAAYTVAAFELFRQRFGAEYDHIVLAVNTDSDFLLQQMNKSKAEYRYIPRAEELAGDFASKKDVIRDTLVKCELETGMIFDVVVDLDLTSPLRTVADIRGTLECLESDDQADIAYSAAESRRSPYFNMVTRKEDGYFHTVSETKFTARQQCPVCFDMNASIYAYRRAYALTDYVMPRKEIVWRMKDTGILDIDSEEDLELLEVIAAYFYQKYLEYREIQEAGSRLYGA